MNRWLVTIDLGVKPAVAEPSTYLSLEESKEGEDAIHLAFRRLIKRGAVRLGATGIRSEALSIRWRRMFLTRGGSC